MIWVALSMAGLIGSIFLAVRSYGEYSAAWFGPWLVIGLVNLVNLIVSLGRLG